MWLATTITAGPRTSNYSPAAVSRLIASRRRGREFCRRAPAPSKRAALIFTIAWSMGSLRAALRRGFASIIGTCRRRCRSRAAGPTATSLKSSPTMRESRPGGWVTASSTGRCSTSPTFRRCLDMAPAVMRPESPVSPTCWRQLIIRTWRTAGRYRPCVPSIRGFGSARCSRCSRRARRPPARPIVSPQRGSTPSGTVLFSILCSRLPIRP